MGLFDYFRSPRQGSASVAKERLQIIVAHERGGRRKSPDYLPALKKELLDVVRKYVAIEQDQVKVHLDRDGECEILELNIVLPDE
ncbi:MAG: cell division topological specificity factor MinE [Candidatus Competibacteraceae bacterium]|nr:cell division topological specificity factor MinE [Candidatus Competibacteraceae bacterium]